MIHNVERHGYRVALGDPLQPLLSPWKLPFYIWVFLRRKWGGSSHWNRTHNRFSFKLKTITIWMHGRKRTMFLLNELFIIAISMFKATITVQITWAITKMRPNVAMRKKVGSSTEIFSSSTLPSNSQNIAMNVVECLKCNHRQYVRLKVLSEVNGLSLGLWTVQWSAKVLSERL